ncbi:MAG: hypothetical protein AAF499_00505 [Pseudomonadota bacterium]
MRRYVVLDHGEVSLWRHGRLVRTWDVGSLAAMPVSGLRVLDGATLVVESGTLQSVRVDMPPLSSADARQFKRRSLEQHAADTCGFFRQIDGESFVQRIDSVPELAELLTWAVARGVRFRRIRHGAQRAEVVYQCLDRPTAALLVGWALDDVWHLAALARGFVVWHRRLTASEDPNDALRETELFALERGFFRTDTEITRVWVGAGDDTLSQVDHVLDLDQLSRALRLHQSGDADPMASAAYSGMLDSARSDLRPPRLSAQWRKRQAAHAIAVLTSTLSVCVLLNFWYARGGVWLQSASDLEEYRTTIGQQQLARQAVLVESLSSAFELSQHWSELPGAAPAALRATVEDVAEAMSSVPALELQHLKWHEADGHHYLAVTVSQATGSVLLEDNLMSSLSAQFEQRGWRQTASDSVGAEALSVASVADGRRVMTFQRGDLWHG